MHNKLAFALVATISMAGGAIATSVLAADLPNLAAKGIFTATDNGFDWEPGRKCRKPIRPRRFDEVSHADYIDAAQDFAECIKNQAEADADYARDRVFAGGQKAADDFVREVERGY